MRRISRSGSAEVSPLNSRIATNASACSSTVPSSHHRAPALRFANDTRNSTCSSTTATSTPNSDQKMMSAVAATVSSARPASTPLTRSAMCPVWSVRMMNM